MKIKFAAYLLILLAFLAAPGFFYEHNLAFSLTLMGWLMLEFTYDLGRKIKPLDLMAIYATAAYLLAPALSYYLVETDWYLGYNFMPVEMKKYFSVAIPGTIGLIAGLYYPFKSLQVDHKEYMEKASEYLADKTDVGIKLFWIGAVCNVLAPIAPGALAFFLLLGSFLIYVGGLYIWFSNDKRKVIYLVAMFVLPMLKALAKGMFGEVVYWTIFLIMVLMMKYEIAFYKKLMLAAAGIVVILFVQSIKYEFRVSTWYQTEEQSMGDKAEVFKGLLTDRVENPEILFGQLMLCGALDRTNQGSITGMAIRYTPEYEPFADGETIFLAGLASFVPRFIWPTKPVVDGKENMKRFTGYEFDGATAMDIGQLGDAYVNFGAWGGGAFLFFFGLFFNFIYAKLFELSDTFSPTLVLWIPMFFAGSIQVDGSVLGTFNNIVKVAMFCAIVYYGFKSFYKQDI